MNLESGGQFGDYQNEIYLDGLSTMPIAFDELKARAQAVLSPSSLSYVAGGAGDESTQRADVSAFLQWGLVPRMPACSAVAPQTVSD
jgi:lactate 2-monooxygenase